MPDINTLLHYLTSLASENVFLLPIILAIGVFFFEDTTVIIAGILAADAIIPFNLALGSIYFGIILGDLILYSIGRLASNHPRLAQYVDHDLVAPFRAWLETRFVLTVFAARFIPGARLPTYTASGFFRSELSRFILTATGATAVWTTLLFCISYWFGHTTSGWLGSARWAIAALFIIALFFIARRNLRAIRARKVTE